MRELAVTAVLDQRGAVDDSLAARDGVSVRSVRETVETARAHTKPHDGGTADRRGGQRVA
jgi:hypothetical protein